MNASATPHLPPAETAAAIVAQSAGVFDFHRRPAPEIERAIQSLLGQWHSAPRPHA